MRFVFVGSKKVVDFWDLVAVRGPDDCWEWIGTTKQDGYGITPLYLRAGKSRLAHRVAYLLTAGASPPVVMHRCDNPPCCNPAHLIGGTQADNLADARRKGRAHSLSVKRGRLAHFNKLSEDQARAIKFAPDNATARRLGAEFGIGKAAIYFIRTGRNWAWL